MLKHLQIKVDVKWCVSCIYPAIKTQHYRMCITVVTYITFFTLKVLVFLSYSAVRAS